MLLLEAVVGDMTVETVRPLMHELEDGDTHVQLDLIVGYYIESFLNVADRVFEAPPVAERVTERITLGSAHGLVVGNVVYRTSSGLSKALATANHPIGRP